MAGASAYAEFVEHVASLRRYALSLTRSRDDAEDLVQECLVRAISAAASLRPGAPVRPWLFRILHNAHVSSQRRQHVRDASAGSLGEDEVSEAPQFSHLELKAALEALDTLPETQRQAVILIALEGMSYAEAAEVLGIRSGTLMSRLARGREALRLALEGKPPARLHVVGGSDD